MNEEVKNEILRLVYSSKRPMPAHFCSSEDRNQTFFIDSDLLDARSDTAMAAQAWGMAEEIPLSSHDITASEYGGIVQMGEDIMLASFFAIKLNGFDLMELLMKEILENASDKFKDFPNLVSVIASGALQEYFEHCIEFGKETAINS